MQDREPKTRFVPVAELRKQLALVADDSETGMFRPPIKAAQPAAPEPSPERTSTLVDAQGAAGIRAQAARKARAAKAEPAPTASSPAPIRLPAVPIDGARVEPSRVEKLLANRTVAIAGLVGAAVIAMVVMAAISGSDETPAPSYAQAAVAPLAVASMAAPPIARPASEEEPSRAGSEERRRPAGPGGGQSGSRVLPAVTCVQPQDKAKQVLAPVGGDDLQEVEVEPPAALSARGAVDLLLAGRRREALDAYRALSIEPGAQPELSVVAELLARELRDCAPGDESCGR